MNDNGKLCKNAGKLRPIVRVQVTFKYELKAQIPAANVTLSPHNFHIQYHHSPTAKIFKGREQRNLVTLVTPRVNSNLLSGQCLWEIWPLSCCRLPPSLYSHQQPGNKMSYILPSWNVFTWILEATGMKVEWGFSCFLRSFCIQVLFLTFLEDTKEGAAEPRI